VSRPQDARQYEVVRSSRPSRDAAGEVAEFDRRVPHWFGSAGDGPAEVLGLPIRERKRIHVRAAPRWRAADRPSGEP
jgi:hypothetical protein